MPKHYTGVVEIYETEIYLAKDNYSTTLKAGTTTERTKTEVARVIVRGDSVSEVTARIREHVELLGDQHRPRPELKKDEKNQLGTWGSGRA